jgi:ferredoxin
MDTGFPADANCGGDCRACMVAIGGDPWERAAMAEAVYERVREVLSCEVRALGEHSGWVAAQVVARLHLRVSREGGVAK